MVSCDRYTAHVIWGECVAGEYANARSDFAGCDLLDKVCGNDYIYNHPEADDDYIWTAIGNLTNSKRRKLIKGCIEIINKYQAEPFSIDRIMPEIIRLKENMA